MPFTRIEISFAWLTPLLRFSSFFSVSISISHSYGRCQSRYHCDNNSSLDDDYVITAYRLALTLLLYEYNHCREYKLDEYNRGGKVGGVGSQAHRMKDRTKRTSMRQIGAILRLNFNLLQIFLDSSVKT